MKRPGAITASIVIMSIISFVGIVFTVFLKRLVFRSLSFNPLEILLFCLLIAVSVVPWLLDVLFLVIRRPWVHYYNVVLLFLLVWGALGQAIALVAMNGVLGVVLAILPTAAAGLLIWLCVVLITRRKTMLEYLNGKEQAALAQ